MLNAPAGPGEEPLVVRWWPADGAGSLAGGAEVPGVMSLCQAGGLRTRGVRTCACAAGVPSDSSAAAVCSAQQQTCGVTLPHHVGEEAATIAGR